MTNSLKYLVKIGEAERSGALQLNGQTEVNIPEITSSMGFSASVKISENELLLTIRNISLPDMEPESLTPFAVGVHKAIGDVRIECVSVEMQAAQAPSFSNPFSIKPGDPISKFLDTSLPPPPPPAAGAPKTKPTFNLQNHGPTPQAPKVAPPLPPSFKVQSHPAPSFTPPPMPPPIPTAQAPGPSAAPTPVSVQMEEGIQLHTQTDTKHLPPVANPKLLFDYEHPDDGKKANLKPPEALPEAKLVQTPIAPTPIKKPERVRPVAKSKAELFSSDYRDRRVQSRNFTDRLVFKVVGLVALIVVVVSGSVGVSTLFTLIRDKQSHATTSHEGQIEKSSLVVASSLSQIENTMKNLGSAIKFWNAENTTAVFGEIRSRIGETKGLESFEVLITRTTADPDPSAFTYSTRDGQFLKRHFAISKDENTPQAAESILKHQDAVRGMIALRETKEFASIQMIFQGPQLTVFRPLGNDMTIVNRFRLDQMIDKNSFGEFETWKLADPNGATVLESGLSEKGGGLGSYLTSFFPRVTSEKTLAQGLKLQSSYSYSESVNRLLFDLLMPIGLLTLISLVMLAVGKVMAQSITRPLEDLTKATETVAAGNYRFRLNIATNDEIGILSDYFNHLTSVIHKKEQELGKVTEIALKDGLTGVYNHGHFRSRFEQFFSTAEKTTQPLSLIFIDIDYFRKINESYGHAQGDLFLVELAQVIRKHTRETDLIARYGGEEFVIALPATSSEDAKGIAEKIRGSWETVEVENLTGAQGLHATCSMGCATLLHQNFTNVEAMITACEELIYYAKENGRNRVEIIAPVGSTAESVAS